MCRCKAWWSFCNQKQADILLLLGPFVDAEHPHVKGGKAEQAFQDIFEDSVSW